MINYVRNGQNDIWIGYHAETAKVVSEIRRYQNEQLGDNFSVMVANSFGGFAFLARCESLDDAKAKVAGWLR